MRAKERNRAAAEWSHEPIAKLAIETAAHLLADGFGELRRHGHCPPGRTGLNGFRGTRSCLGTLAAWLPRGSIWSDPAQGACTRLTSGPGSA